MTDKFKKLDSETLEVTREVKHNITKEVLLESKAALEKDLADINAKLNTLK